MDNDIPEMEKMPLGDFLRKTRKEKGLDLEQIGAETRISASNLRAIEADDFSQLPADAFARGFYTLYAKSVGLDPGEIVARYMEEKGNSPKTGRSVTQGQAPGKIAKQVSSMAEPRSITAASSFGLLLLVLILLGAGICWYLNINPASYISEQLRGLQQEEPALPAPIDESDDSPAPQAATTPAADIQQAVTAPAADIQEDAKGGKYHLEAEFLDPTQVTLKIDDTPARELTLEPGQITHWKAEKAIVLTLPPKARVRLKLNDIPLDLPQTGDEHITLNIPEDLLE